MRLGQPDSPILFDAAHLTGNFAGAGISGKFSGARSTIGNVPLLLSDASGGWRVHHGDLSVDSALTVSDRDANLRPANYQNGMQLSGRPDIWR